MELQVLPFILLLFLCNPSTLLSLNRDGTLLLSFKQSLLKDPMSVLSGWNSGDEIPCSWNGVVCMGFPAIAGDNDSVSRVISLVLPNAHLIGSISGDLGMVEHLRHLDLSGNALNGTLPLALFNASELRVLSLSDNDISGELPELFGQLRHLQVVNLSDNALMGSIPRNLTLLPNLTSVSLRNNYISGELPNGGFEMAEVLDLGSNLVNGSIPAKFTGGNLRYLNLSFNRLSGEIPLNLGEGISPGLTLDLSFNNFSGEIPISHAFQEQKIAAFAGNEKLCGKPLRIVCTIPSTLSNPPNNSSPAKKSPPAFAAIPKSGGRSRSSVGLKPATIATIAIGDLAGISLIFIIILFIHQRKKRSFCLRKKPGHRDETSESNASETEEDGSVKLAGEGGGGKAQPAERILVSVDGETEMELETLLKASAYILGTAGSSIVYKAVLADGKAFAVRRIGDIGSVEKLRDFELQVRSIARLRHPNVLPLRCFNWGPDEKLLIHDYAVNGSLANVFFSKKLGSSPFHFSWDSRLRVARGVARGMAYLHEKKCVHGNLKPSNILLTSSMEPLIGDLGVDRILFSGIRHPAASSSKRSNLSHSSLPDLSSAAVAVVSGSSPPPYQSPESLNGLKPSPKWDVYSFGMVLLELLSGRVLLEVELMQWNGGLVGEERKKVVGMADPAIRGEIEGKEEALLSCFKLGFGCASAMPQRRPAMKEALQVLERVVLNDAGVSSASSG